MEKVITYASKLSVLAAERFVADTDGDEMDTWYHASLYLSETHQDGRREAHQRLCFNNANGWLLTPNIKPGFEDLAAVTDLSAKELFEGNALAVLNLWNGMLTNAHHILKQGDKFGPDYKNNPKSLNCRTGVLASVRAVGLELNRDMVKSGAGLQYPDLDRLIVPESSLPVAQSISDALKLKDELTAGLPAVVGTNGPRI